MPNVCNNYLTITGPRGEISRLVTTAVKDGTFSYDSFLPADDDPNNEDPQITCARQLWDMKSELGETTWSLTFGTPWGPSQMGTALVAEAFPALDFHHGWVELGMNMAGFSIHKDGAEAEDVTMDFDAAWDISDDPRYRKFRAAMDADWEDEEAFNEFYNSGEPLLPPVFSFERYVIRLSDAQDAEKANA